MRAEFDDYLMQYYHLQSDDCIMTHNVTFSTKGDECQRKLNAIFDQCECSSNPITSRLQASANVWQVPLMVVI